MKTVAAQPLGGKLWIRDHCAAGKPPSAPTTSGPAGVLPPRLSLCEAEIKSCQKSSSSSL
eukprot:3300319-Pyramimonas_sp.AAC.1